MPVSEDEIRAGMVELKTLLDKWVDSRHDLDDRQKQLAKQENGYVVNGLSNDVVAFLFQRGYRIQINY